MVRFLGGLLELNDRGADDILAVGFHRAAR